MGKGNGHELSSPFISKEDEKGNRESVSVTFRRVQVRKRKQGKRIGALNESTSKEKVTERACQFPLGVCKQEKGNRESICSLKDSASKKKETERAYRCPLGEYKQEKGNRGSASVPIRIVQVSKKKQRERIRSLYECAVRKR